MSMPQFRCLSKKVRLKGLQPATETLRLHIVAGGDRKLSHVVIKDALINNNDNYLALGLMT